MPRLQGKSSKAPSLVTIVIVLVAVFLVIEYLGIIDLVPNFGRARTEVLHVQGQ